MDVVPGGLFNTAKELQEGYNEGFKDAGKILLIKYSIHPEWRTLLDNNCFIPTISSLGFKNTSFDWSSPVNNRNLVQTGEIYFDDYYAPNQNEPHVTLTNDNVMWINNWLTKVACGNFNNIGQIEGNIYFKESSTFQVGNLPPNATVSWTIENNPGLSLNASGNSITVKNINSLSSSIILKATISDPCGSIILSKNITALPSYLKLSSQASLTGNELNNYGLKIHRFNTLT